MAAIFLISKPLYVKIVNVVYVWIDFSPGHGDFRSQWRKQWSGGFIAELKYLCKDVSSLSEIDERSMYWSKIRIHDLNVNYTKIGLYIIIIIL